MKQEDGVRIPEPRIKLPLLGHLFYLKSNLIEAFRDLSSKLGSIYRLKLGDQTLILISDLELIREVCDDTRFGKYVAANTRYLFRNGVLVAETNGPFWGKAHRILLPGFKPQTIQENYFPEIVDVAKQLLKKWENTPKGKEINLNVGLSSATLDFIGLCAFNFHFNALSSDETHPYIKKLDEVFSYIQKSSFLPGFLTKLQFRKNRAWEDNVSSLYKYADDILEERKKQNGLSSGRKDLLSMMLHDVDRITNEKLNTADVREEIVNLLVAGAETNSSLLTSAFYALMTHPHVLEKAYEEVDRVLGTDINKPLSPQDFLRLTYVNKILNECLRLWPPVFLIERTPLKDTLLGGKYSVKKGEDIWLLYVILHRDKVIWGKDADSFNPDRFDQEFMAKLDPCAFLPFGVGSRTCMGRQLAMFVVPVILGMILQRYRLHLRPKYKFGLTVSITLRFNPMWVTLEKRECNPIIQKQENVSGS